MSLGKKLAEARENKGYSQNEIAEILHVSRQTVSNWERDITEPDTGLLNRISKICDAPLDELIAEAKKSASVFEDTATENEKSDCRGDAKKKQVKQKKIKRKRIKLVIIVGAVICAILAASVVVYFIHRGNEAEIQNFDDMTVLSLENDSYVEEDILFLEDDIVSTAE